MPISAVSGLNASRLSPLKLAWCQSNPLPGDIAVNSQTILSAIQQAVQTETSLLALPELCLMGYPIRDVIGRFPALVEKQVKQLYELAAQVPESLTVLVGFVEPRPATVTGRRFYNSVAVLQGGKVQGIARKTLLPTYEEYDDWRMFEPSAHAGLLPATWLGQDVPEGVSNNRKPILLNLQGWTLAITICEDIWTDAEAMGGSSYYLIGPVDTLQAEQPDLWINLAASAYRFGRRGTRYGLLSRLALKTQAPVLYVNQVGGVDEQVFDGNSQLLSSTGDTLLKSPSCEEGFYTFELGDLAKANSKASSQPVIVSSPPAKPLCPVLEDRSAELTEVLTLGIRDYFRKCGFKRAVLGLSGGIDSSVTAGLLVKALGGDNVLGVGMPTVLTPEVNRQEARDLATSLGMRWAEMPIDTVTEPAMLGLKAIEPSLQTAWGSPATASFAADNVQAMTRATMLRLLGNEFQALPIATSDKSEFYLGYTTVNGDMSGALAPLGDVTKTQVRQLAQYLNQVFPQAFPEGVLTRPSGADLAVDPDTGKLLLAEDALMPYLFADEVIWRLECLKQSFEAMLAERFVYEAVVQPLSQEQKQLWLEKFLTRMTRSVFKWWVAPPMLVVSPEGGSLAKSVYRHPLVATGLATALHY
jgi:NAD+ synthase (glutamine-hydrolysing)